MALHDVFVEVSYLDAAERTAVVSYMLETRYDDAVPNFPDVAADAAGLVTQLKLLSWSQVTDYKICVVLDGADTAANISANNQVHAFSRLVDETGKKFGMDVPAWDDLVYDQDSNNLLSAAYNTAAALAAAHLRNPETGGVYNSISFTQSRTHKSRNRIS